LKSLPFPAWIRSIKHLGEVFKYVPLQERDFCGRMTILHSRNDADSAVF
jgi:hypothetical protein